MALCGLRGAAFSLGPDGRAWLASLCFFSAPLLFLPHPLPHPESPHGLPQVAVSAATSLTVQLASLWLADMVSVSYVQDLSISVGQVLSSPPAVTPLEDLETGGAWEGDASGWGRKEGTRWHL